MTISKTFHNTLASPYCAVGEGYHSRRKKTLSVRLKSQKKVIVAEGCPEITTAWDLYLQSADKIKGESRQSEEVGEASIFKKEGGNSEQP